jgi:hypothetical protein
VGTSGTGPTGDDIVEVPLEAETTAPESGGSRRNVVAAVAIAVAVVAALAGVAAILVQDDGADNEKLAVSDLPAESTSTEPPITVAVADTTVVPATTAPTETTATPATPPPLPVVPTTPPGPSVVPVPPVGSPYAALEACPCTAPNGSTFGGGPRYGPLTVGTDFIAVLGNGVIGWMRVGDAIGEHHEFGAAGVPVYDSDGETLIGHLATQGVSTVFVPV